MSQEKVAIITGITGQDGSYLAENLLNNNYKVIGMKRRCSSPNDARLINLNVAKNKGDMIIEEGDITDLSNIMFFLLKYKPTHFFNLAAQSHVATSFNQPKLTWDVTAQGAMNCLEAIRLTSPTTKFYQASSSEMYGDSYDLEPIKPTSGDIICGIDTNLNLYHFERYQDENTKFNPQSPYAIAKLAAYNATRLYRQSYGLFASNGILFNHESVRRGELFVTRKITKYVANLKKSLLNLEGLGYGNLEIKTILQSHTKLKLGNLNASRDWGHAPDYCDAMRKILEHNRPDDFVIGTGESYTVEDFCRIAFSSIKLDYKNFVEIDSSLMRPSEVPYLRAKPTKALKELGWSPSTSFKELVEKMINYDYQTK